jgi:hypothetical protein
MKTISFGKCAAVAGVATALAAGLAVGVSPTAQAAEQWGGIATGPDGHWALWSNSATRTAAAYFGNWVMCGTDCKRVLLFAQCGALASNGSAWSAAEGATTQEAESVALGDLPGSTITMSQCNDDGGPVKLSWRG